MTALVVAVGWIVGAAAGLAFTGDVGVYAIAGGMTALVAAWRGGAGLVRGVALAVAATLFGVARVAFGGMPTPPEALSGVAGPVTLAGRVVEAPTPRGGRLDVTLALTRIERPSTGRVVDPSAPPRVLVRGIDSDVRYGDLLVVGGRLDAPRSRPGYPLAELLARRGIFHVLEWPTVRAREAGGPNWWGGLLDLRTTLEGRLRSALPEPAASLVAGVVIGGRAGFSPDLRDALAATGTGHIVAVSGFNVVVLAAAMRMALVPIVGQRWALLPMALVVWLYAVLVGAPPSAVRAAIMVSFVFLAQAVGRLPDPITALALTAATMVAWDSSTLTDLGFQLSVAATAGLVLFTARIADRLPHLPVPAIPGRLVREPLAVALAAQLATLPIVLGTFHTLSTVAPVANVLIGPLVPATMLLGGVLAVVAPLPGLGTLVAWPTWAVASGVLGIVETLADLPGSVIFTGRWPVLATVAWYAILLGWVAVRSADVQALFDPWQVRRARWGMVGASLLVLPATLFLPDGSGGRATATLLDAGGLAVLARSSEGRTALVVGDGSPLALAASLGQHLRFAERGLDLVVVTGDGRTGEALTEALRRYSAAAIVGPRTDDDSSAEGDRTRLDVRSGQRFAVGSDVVVEIVDVREHGGRPAVDVLLRIGAVAVWLPAPGPPSVRWEEVVAEDRPAVLRRPTRSPGWAREAPAQPWLAVVTDTPDGARSGAVMLDQRTHGAVVVAVDDDEAPSVRPERCASGGSCSVTPRKRSGAVPA